MRREDLGDLTAFLAVAEESSFTRAAAKLGTSQSSLSHTVQRLEARLGIRLLTRTTRSVVPTAAGEQLLATLRPALADIDGRLEALTALRDKPAGLIRINSGQHAAHSILWPCLARFLPQYPDISVEIAIDQALSDVVGGRFDAGVRLGEHVERDMIAVRIGPDLRLAVVGSPAYFRKRDKPRSPHDLAGHQCINLRQQTQGGFYVWEFAKGGRELSVRVNGALIVNEGPLAIRAAVDGVGLAIVMEDLVAGHVETGKLVRVLADWCEPFAGYHLYFPNRRQLSPAFSLLVDALRYRPSNPGRGGR